MNSKVVLTYVKAVNVVIGPRLNPWFWILLSKTFAHIFARIPQNFLRRQKLLKVQATCWS